MKILDNKNTIAVVCSKCNSILSVSRNDINYHYHFGHSSYFYIDCKACSARVEFNREKAPHSWQSTLENKIIEAMGGDYI